MASLNAKCTVCLEDLIVGKVAALGCGHTFHLDCITAWLKKSQTCPECRVKATERNLIKQLYFNADEACSSENVNRPRNNDELLRRVEDLELQLALKESESLANVKDFGVIKAKEESAIIEIDKLRKALIREQAKAAESARKLKEQNANAKASESVDKLKVQNTKAKETIADLKGRLAQEKKNTTMELKQAKLQRSKVEAEITKLKKAVAREEKKNTELAQKLAVLKEERTKARARVSTVKKGSLPAGEKKKVSKSR